MNRKLRLDGTWYKRNGPKGSNAAWLWDYLNEPLLDTLNLDTALLEFSYTPAGNVPEGAYNDPLNLDSSILEFSYTPDGNVPEGAFNDPLTLEPDIVNFSYTI